MVERDYSSLSALVIDDQSFIRKVVCGVLRQLGFKLVMEASDGGDGLMMAKKFRPDVILCDIEMEPIDGLVFLETLRNSKDSAFPDARVIFLTQHAESGVVDQARKLGVNAFLVKPASAQQIKNRIDFVLGRD